MGATEEQRAQVERQYLKRLVRLGILPEQATVDNILDLSVKDLMERRLQTIVYRIGLAKTVHQGRQFVIHGHISVAGGIVTVPSYIVRKDEESRIAFHQRSALNNPQHPARTLAGVRRLARAVEQVAPVPPVKLALPEAPPEIKEIVQTEQPIEIVEPEELPAEAEEKKP